MASTLSYAAGAKAQFDSPSGLGSWTFVTSDSSTPGAGTETILEYSTSANGVRAANAFITPSSKSAFDLPAIGTETGVLITPGNREGTADSSSLALHPGNHATHKFLMIKFKANNKVDVTGYAYELGAHCGGIDVWMYADSMEICKKDGLNNDSPFTLTQTAVGAGATLTVVIGPHGSYSCDHSSLSLKVKKALPRATRASLRDDYFAKTFAVGAKAQFDSPSGLGSWTFSTSNSNKPGGSEIVLEYSTSANGVRAANSFITPGSRGHYDLPAIGTTTGVLITPANHEGTADSSSLALHPGNSADVKYLVVRFKAAEAVDVSGYAIERGAHCGGINVWMYSDTAEVCSKNGLNNGSPFTLTDTTVPAGSTLAVFIGPHGSYACDHSSLSLTMKKAKPRASLRGDYFGTTFTAGAQAQFDFPSGLGSWTFVTSDSSTPGAGTETILEYSTSANGVRAANAFITPSSKSAFDLPAIGTETGVLITPGNREGTADSSSLALHPGNHATHKFLMIKFKANNKVDVTGYAYELGAHCGGIDVWMYADSMEICKKDGLNNDSRFTLTAVTLSAGSTLTVVIGPNGGYSCDHSALSLTMNQV